MTGERPASGDVKEERWTLHWHDPTEHHDGATLDGPAVNEEIVLIPESRAITAEQEAERLREALEQLADAERVEETDAWDWAVWAHDLAQAALSHHQPEEDPGG